MWAPPTDGSASSFWPTPTASDYGSSQNGINGVGGANERPSAGTAILSTRARHWPTPRSSDGTKGAESAETVAARRAASGAGSRNLVDEAVKPATWPTPQARDGDARRAFPTEATAAERFEQGKRNLTDAAAMWPTPVASDGKGQTSSNRHTPSLPDRALWPTPTAGDAKASGSRNLEGSQAHAGVSLTDAAITGGSTSSRRARTRSRDGMVLNPLFVEAMQGFPSGWSEGGARKTGHQTGFDF